MRLTTGAGRFSRTKSRHHLPSCTGFPAGILIVSGWDQERFSPEGSVERIDEFPVKGRFGEGNEEQRQAEPAFDRGVEDLHPVLSRLFRAPWKIFAPR